jgi:hypothetical protein
MSGGKEWTTHEMRVVDAALRCRTPAPQCSVLLPGRSIPAIKDKFMHRRAELGLDAPTGRPFGSSKRRGPDMPIDASVAAAAQASAQLHEATTAMFWRKARANGVSFDGAKLATLYSHDELLRMSRVGLAA